MALVEKIKEMKEELEEAKKAETEAAEKEDAALDAPIEEKSVEEKKDEKAVEDVVEPAAVDEKPAQKTSAEAARERREKKKREDTLAAELVEARQRIAELSAPKEEPKTDKDPEPDKAEDPQAWNEWKIRKQDAELAEVRGYIQEETRGKATTELRQAAISQLNSFENDVVRDNPDYPQAKQYYATMVATFVKGLHPDITNQQLSVAVENEMIKRAGRFMRDGHENPVQAMYEEAKTWGFKPQPAEQEEKELKPDLDKIAANKARNSGMAGAGGKGGSAEITPKVAATMTNAEFARLKPEEKKKIYDRLRAAG